MIYDVYGDGVLLYQSPTMTFGSAAIPIDLNVAGVTTLKLTVLAAPGSSAAGDHAVWADARLVSTANFGTQPDTLSWQLSQNGTVISTQTTDSFVFAAMSGTYTLTLTVTDAQGDTATASTSVVVTAAVASATFVARDSTTAGRWVGTYGTQGYDVIGSTASIPSYAKVTPSGQSSDTWAATSTDPRALQTASGPSGIAACWYSSTSFSVDVNMTPGQSHLLELYFLDWDSNSRSESVTLSYPVTGTVLSYETVSSFHSGAYLDWTVSGNVLITITRTAGVNAVLSGLFFDPPLTSNAATAAATYLSQDSTTEGTWIGTYGTQEYDLIGSTASIPSYATVTPSAQSSWTWAATTTDRRALQTASGTSRIAAGWYASSSFSVDVNFTDGKTHDLELYFVDWDSTAQRERNTQRCSLRCGAQYRDCVVIPLGGILGVGGERKRAHHVQDDVRVQCRAQRALLRSGDRVECRFRRPGGERRNR